MKQGITREELLKIKKSIKDPKFGEILSEYMLEISDPNNKQENDEYLQQLQKDGELPEGMTLIKPEKYFCIETQISSEKDYMFQQQLYVNVCVHESVEEPNPQKIEGKGYQWSLPHFIGKQRFDQDYENEDKKIVTVIDVVFNKSIINLIKQYQGFQKMICDISIDAVNKRLLTKKEKANQDYQISKIDCKGQCPSIMPIKNSNTSNQRENTKLYHEINEMKRKAEEDKQQNQQEQEQDEQQDLIQEEVQVYPMCPKYKMVYVYSYGKDLYTNTKAVENDQACQLRIEIQLNKVDNLKELKCEFINEYLKLEYLDIYFMNLKIRDNIDEEYKAKFDRQKKILIINFTLKNNLKVQEISTSQQVQENDDNDENKNLNQEQQNKQSDYNDNSKIQQIVQENQEKDEKIQEIQKNTINTDQQQDLQVKNQNENQEQFQENQLNQNIESKQLKNFEIFSQNMIDNKHFIILSTQDLNKPSIMNNNNIFFVNQNNQGILFETQNCQKIDISLTQGFLTIQIDYTNQQEQTIKIIPIDQKNKSEIINLYELKNYLSVQQPEQKLKKQNQKLEKKQEQIEDSDDEIEIEKETYEFINLNLVGEIFTIFQII